MNEQESFIGKWAIRKASHVFEHGKAHLIQSEITDRLVAKCGRQLRLTTPDGTFREFVARRLETRCLQCQRRP